MFPLGAKPLAKYFNALTHLILKTTLGYGYSYYFHFIDEEIEVWRSEVILPSLVRGRRGNGRVCCLERVPCGPCRLGGVSDLFPVVGGEKSRHSSLPSFPVLEEGLAGCVLPFRKHWDPTVNPHPTFGSNKMKVAPGEQRGRPRGHGSQRFRKASWRRMPSWSWEMDGPIGGPSPGATGYDRGVELRVALWGVGSVGYG